MSRGTALIAGVAGMIAGAVAGAPYLSNADACAPAETSELSCSLSSAALPFLSAIAIGLVAGIALAHVGGMVIRRLLAPALIRRSAPAASEIDESPVPTVSWGLESREGRSLAERTGEEESRPEAPPRRDIPLGSRGKPKPTPRIPD